MTWLRKMRPVLVVVGLATAIGSMVGARALTHGSGDATAKPADTGPRSASAGLVVMGAVDTDPPPVQYGLPSILASGMVAKVHVKEGAEVKEGDPLYEFDATIQKANVKTAEAAVRTANKKVKEAEEIARQHATQVKIAEDAVEAAERKRVLTKKGYEMVEANLERGYIAEGKAPETFPKLKQSSSDLYKANVEYDTAVHDKMLAEQRRNQLKAADPQVHVEFAKAGVEQAEAEEAKARAAVDLCVVRAKTAGTVEQLTIGPGTTLGVGTRAPALWLIPGGARVVRAEVETEFAHRVGPNLEGKAVVIADHTDPKLTYAGTVRRVPSVFMLKRASAENFLGGDTRVIEVLVEVTPDPNPSATKPPLRVGQRVRVNLGQ
jgi:multidrug resistance efflux pump